MHLLAEETSLGKKGGGHVKPLVTTRLALAGAELITGRREGLLLGKWGKAQGGPGHRGPNLSQFSGQVGVRNAERQKFEEDRRF